MHLVFMGRIEVKNKYTMGARHMVGHFFSCCPPPPRCEAHQLLHGHYNRDITIRPGFTFIGRIVLMGFNP